ncbi:putative methyltransferase-domain-containing protein [Durotheca rogersii]|uniref:putative methyltransferase-domain-containing protein n=1 Tax=Durotheca rogersii TaxID=419775 RepID=UPI00221FC7A6|nr:putative methyltransferase-domain-containing protein [Durotheca rogersii]KAI5864094.1 putative methyltransferase-domain-containing protein [Durotheca rogersii]
MAYQDVDPELLLLRRQYLQLFEPDFLAWPPPRLLKSADAQTWLHKHLFDAGRNPRLPPEQYQLRVLTRLVAKIEKTTEDPPEAKISQGLVAAFASLAGRVKHVEFEPTPGPAYVTFTCIPEARNDGEDGDVEPTVTLLERRHMVSGSRTTGFRTWEGSLHLGAYLLSAAGARLIRAKNVLELGAGTGFLSALLAGRLCASYVAATDGDEAVVAALRQNLALNGLDDARKARAETLRWGDGLEGTWVEGDCKARPYDVVIGADITYDKVAIVALVSTLRSLFDLRAELVVIIAGVVRNAETFQTFRDECACHCFLVADVDFEPKPMRQQKALFYAAAVPIKILRITRPV